MIKDTWGWADDQCNVYVKDGDSERLIGSYPDGTPEEALAYYRQKYDAFANRVELALMRTLKVNTRLDSLRKGIKTLRQEVDEALILGDLDALRKKLDQAESNLEKVKERIKLERDEIYKQKLALVEELEELASTEDHKNVRWGDLNKRAKQIMHRWHDMNKSQVRHPESDKLWRRIRSARALINKGVDGYFSDLKAQNHQISKQKHRLIAKAEGIKADSDNAYTEYQALLNEWKNLPRVSKEEENSLWDSFKKAGDPIFDLHKQRIEESSAQEQAALQVKEQLLEEAKQLVELEDHLEARKAYLALLDRWEAAGRVPREKVKPLEKSLRDIDTAIKRKESDHWQKTDPEKEARSQGFLEQLNAKLTDLQARLETEEAAGRDTQKLREEIEKTRSFIAVIGS